MSNSMKLAAFDHPKTLALKSALKCSYPAVIGHLELLWKFTGQHATQGNIGKWSDSAIAGACGWEDAPEAFIEALVISRYVNRDSVFRLVVHDWPEHCQQWVRAKLAKAKLPFIVTKEAYLDASQEAYQEASSSLAKPSLAKPSLVRERRAIALPPDFNLDDSLKEYAKKEGIQDVERELDAFKDHYLANGKRFLRWDLTWKNWCRRSKSFQFEGRSSGRKLSAVELVREANRGK